MCIRDRTEEEESVVRQDGSMLVEASMNLDDFMEAMGIMNYDDLTEEDLSLIHIWNRQRYRAMSFHPSTP